ncbi:MAG TPA: phosphoribosylformylglycinamidine cyclo-ligase [Thermoplasmata archaeon]|nr:phosphoribosylformylglycinamidine cyclo-ligase [Thermoplasmata archaeon]
MPRGSRAPAWTYARSGVDRGEIGAALQGLLSSVRYRPADARRRAVGPSGHYAGLVRVGRETIAATTDTVGTKVLLAAQLGRWAEVGEDMVAINVNDLASVGARPFGFVDTISAARPDRSVFQAIGRGLDRGLRAARCALLGGETAIVPDIVEGIDLGGTALGHFPDRNPVFGTSIRPGDRIVGIPSSGVHSNGFTLVRRLLEKGRVSLRSRRPGGRGSVGEELLRPTRTYVAVSEAVTSRHGVHGLAHISGGGVRNLVRLHHRVRFVLDEWPEPPALFRWLQALGPVEDREMFQTFNMGIGFVVIVPPARLDAALGRLARAGIRDARPVGTVSTGSGVSLPPFNLTYSGYS